MPGRQTTTPSDADTMNLLALEAAEEQSSSVRLGDSQTTPQTSPSRRVMFAITSGSEQDPGESPSSEGQRSRKRRRLEERVFSSHPTITQSAPPDRLRILSDSQGTPPPPTRELVEFAPSFRQLENKLWEEIRKRMIAVAEDIRRCIPEAHPIFHHNAEQPATADIAFRLLKHPLQVPTVDLSEIFRLRQCHAHTAPQKDAAMVYYIRTFPILRSQLLTIIADWEMSSRHYDAVPHWLNHLESMKTDDTTIYLRYVGMTEGGKMAWNRFWDDIKQRKSGILAAFLEEIVNRYPDVLDNSTIHEVLSATSERASEPTSGWILSDIYTARVGHRSLLQPQNQILQIVWEKRRPQDGAAEFEISGRLSRWVEKVRQFGLDHPDETLVGRFPMTVEYCQSVVKEQAHPRRALFKGRPLMVLFGKDVTLEDFQGGNTFLSGVSRAGSLTVELLSRLHQAEYGFGEPQVLPFIAGQFPLVDMFNYIGRQDPAAQIELARAYFQAMEPRIIVTFSQLVSAWTAAGFIHAHGLPSTHYLDHVGKPLISHYDDPMWIHSQENPSSHTAFIQVPHIHPGRDKYGKQPEALRRVLLLTWMSTLAINFFMIQELQALVDRFDDPDDFDEAPHREQLCFNVIKRYDQEAATLVMALERAKDELGRVWEAQNKARVVLPTAIRSAPCTRHAQDRVSNNQLADGISHQSEGGSRRFGLRS